MFMIARALLLAAALLCGGLAGAAAGENPAAAVQGPKKTKLTGVVLINPDNAGEAMLLVQIMVPDDQGEVKPQVVGVPLADGETARQLIKEFGVVGARPDGPAEDQTRAQAEAKTKIVVVTGTVTFGENGPKQIAVESYVKSKELVDTAVPDK